MDYFYNWYNENGKFTYSKKQNSVEKYLIFVGAFTHNVKKILNSFYYIPFHHEANQIFDFIKKYIISSTIDFEVLNTIEMNDIQRKFIMKCISCINADEKFDNSKYRNKNTEFFIRIAYFLFLLVLKTKAFLEIYEFLKNLRNKGQHLLDLKLCIHQLINNQNQILLPNLYKSRIIHTMISSWQKESIIYLENLQDTIHNPFYIKEIYLQYNGIECTYLVKNTDNFTKYITVNESDEVTMLNEKTGRHEKTFLTPKQHIFNSITMTNRYYKFFTNIFAPYTDFILNGTNLSDADIIETLKNSLRYHKISIATEIKLLSVSIFGPMVDTDSYNDYRKYLSCQKKLKSRQFVLNEMDYFFFLSDDNNILSNYENIIYSDVQFYFQGEIAFENSFVYIKNSNLIYKKFKTTHNPSKLIELHRNHCYQRKQNKFEYFRNGFKKALIQNISPGIVKMFSNFVKLLLVNGYLSQEFKLQNWLLILEFDIFEVKIPYTNQFDFVFKDIQHFYNQKLQSLKDLIYKKLNNKKKTINIGKYTISYIPEEGYSLPSLNIFNINKKEDFVDKVHESCKNLTLDKILHALLPKHKELIQKFLEYIFTYNPYIDIHQYFLLENRHPVVQSNHHRCEKFDNSVENVFKKKKAETNKKKIISFLQNYQGWEEKNTMSV